MNLPEKIRETNKILNYFYYTINKIKIIKIHILDKDKNLLPLTPNEFPLLGIIIYLSSISKIKSAMDD
jgi:hypothetical protein